MSILRLPFVDVECVQADLAQVPHLASQWISRYLTSPCVVLLQAEVGVGKTTLLQHLLSPMGVDPQHLVSPTFSLHHVLFDSRGLTHHHFDLYRVRSVFELEELELDAYLAKSSDYVWLEWADLIPAAWLPPQRACYLVRIQMLPGLQGVREYRWQKHEIG
ncbi:MAG: tRNA (adenosine(37)-N6)-threonylcarbamoyltransferase complex ATPase subunit type 1 TsaE [Bdellovibrionaceae bacterium]|nr:tRNA (adenosine(37)-N6)-threonylcarbamoyltransferase complex ATPase subunit type 1 TsaE [Pseudobdellovibrionaceae bacterium]